MNQRREVPGQDYNQDIYARVIPEIARLMGLDSLPMRDPNFNFYGMISLLVRRQTSLQGQELHDGINDVFTSLLFSMNPKKPGVEHSDLFQFPAWYESHLETDPRFDDFFTMIARRKVLNLGRDKARERRRSPKHSITTGEGDGEFRLPAGAESTFDLVEREEQRQKFRKLMIEEVPKAFSHMRNGEAMREVWRMKWQHYTLKEMVFELNELKIPRDVRQRTETDGSFPEEARWTKNAVDRLLDNIVEYASVLVKRAKLDWDSVKVNAGRKSSRIRFGRGGHGS